MEIGGNTVQFFKKIAKLEAHCDQLKEEKISLKEQLMEAQGKEKKMIVECAKVKDKYVKVKAEFGLEKSKWREEEGNLREIYWQVEVEKKKLEIDLKAAKRRVTNSCVEVAQKLMDKDKHFKSLLEGNRLDMDFEASMAKVKEEFDSKERKWREEEEKMREECRQLNIEKKKLELDLETAKRGVEDDGDSVAKKLKAAQAEAEGLKSLLQEKDGSIITLLSKNENLERENRRFEMDFHARMAVEANKRKVEEKKILELTQKIEVLEGEKGKIEAAYCKLKEDKMSEPERVFRVKKALEEAEKKRGKMARDRITQLVKRIAVLERVKEAEKMAMEEEGKQKVLRLTHRIEVLEREKREIEANFDLVNREKSEEIKGILNEKVAIELEKKEMEAESKKRVLELVERLEVLEIEKNEMEAKVCQAEQEKNDEILRISNEKRAVKEDDYEKTTLELVDRNDILEREKQVFEAEIAERDELIKVLAQDIISLKDKKKELEMEINRLASKLMEDGPLSQHARLTNNVVTLSTPRLNEGQNSAGVALFGEHNRSISHDVENSDGQYEDAITHTNACKRKRTAGKWEEPGRTCDSNGGDVQVASGNIACEWQVDQDVLDAFDAHPELCLKAVCALYRRHKRLGAPKNTSLSSEGIALAEYVISEDPEGRKMKKMVAKLDKVDRDAVGECINIAKQHYKQVFEIYKNNEDPVFLS